ncbi:CaiB/BaiF CoA transferase family protein [Nocardioides marmotae]|uniref:CaiB/BaiF CoA transferase family protein n=1 Tax=Nocardioides marmotae TaxID=2663857 RepID=UPI0012B5681F|nr:CaiB/BaiF CoA-transferase family protein [Nocardioides marmotae]MBC9732342.1 CoA transferase [Nocardioides marmotae]MTB83462.1 CoA transferase [Nocardioides marmotae]
MSRPLSGLTVVELGTAGPAPFACMILADLGADVVRLERPDASVRPFPGASVLGRGRRRVSADLKDAAGVRTVLEMSDEADVLVEGFRPGVLERLGLGPDVLLDRNPRLVVGRVTGWGQDGPWSRHAGHDLNFIAATGALHAMVPAGEVPSYPLAASLNFGGGSMFLVAGILAALHERSRTGAGQVVDASIAEGISMLLASSYGLVGSGVPLEPASSQEGSPYYGTYRCSDGRYVAVAALERGPRSALARVVGLGEVEGDDPTAWPVVRERMTAAFASAPRDTWLERTRDVDASITPVVEMTEAPGLPQAEARGAFDRRDGVVHPVGLPRLAPPRSMHGNHEHKEMRA